MKAYEKPKLFALSLSGNDRLCGDCRDNGASMFLYNNLGLASQLVGMMEWMGYVNSDNNIDRSDFTQCFGSSESCKYQVDGYCKFTSATTVAWS